MSNIIAGRFETLEQAESAKQELRRRQFNGESVTSFYVNPPGQHDQFPIGGDEDADPGADVAHVSSAKGATIGAIVGALLAGLVVVAFSIVGVVAIVAAVLVAVGVGAYMGSLIGTLGGVHKRVEEPPIRRKSGVLVAVRADGIDAQQTAYRILLNLGAHDIEKARGALHKGKWLDFDPTRPPISFVSSQTIGQLRIGFSDRV